MGLQIRWNGQPRELFARRQRWGWLDRNVQIRTAVGDSVLRGGWTQQPRAHVKEPENVFGISHLFLKRLVRVLFGPL